MKTARSQAVQLARQKITSNPLYLDTETTGIDRASEIVEIAILDDEGQVIFNSLVRPTVRIPQDVIRIHGITNEQVAGASTWLHIWPQVEAILSGRQVGIYNSEFDLRMFSQTHARSGMRWPAIPTFSPFCIMKLHAQFAGQWNAARGSYRWYSLEDAGRQFRISLPNSHRARDDSLLARAVLHAIADTPE